MKQQIQLAAVVLREGRLMLVRPRIGSPWELPGGPFAEDDDDMDAAMDRLLDGFGIDAPAIEEDFVETLFLRQPGGQLVLNLYAPTEWTGEPVAPVGTGLGWFALDELEAVEMEPQIRHGVLQAFGLEGANDVGADVLQAIERELGAETAPRREAGAFSDVEMPIAKDRRQAKGLGVLHTLHGGAPDSEENLRENYPELADDIIGALSDTWGGPEIDRKTRSLQVVAMLAALGRPAGLRTHIEGALNHGASPEQVVATMRMVAVYAGFPAALEAWPVMEDVFAARGIDRQAPE